MAIPSVTTEQMREVDRLMVEEYGIDLLQMMENAGLSLARLASSLAEGRDGSALVLAGKGNNGGGGMAAARHLSNMGRRVRVVAAGRPSDLRGVPARQAATLRTMGVETLAAEELAGSELRRLLAEAGIVIDAIIGYSLSGAPRGFAAAMIEAANESETLVLSLDVPSGVDAGSGEVHEPSVRADATMSLALPKTGMATPAARERLGRLYIADISVPPGLYRRLGLDVEPMFADDAVVELRWDGAGWTAARS